MLARLEKLPGIREAWLSWDGLILVVIPQSGADPTSAIDLAFGNGYARQHGLDGMEREAALRSFGSGQRWVRSTSAHLLSADEARIVADRIVSWVSRRVVLSPAAAARLHEAVRRCFFAVLSLFRSL